jgi:hypothetical protein
MLDRTVKALEVASIPFIPLVQVQQSSLIRIVADLEWDLQPVGCGTGSYRAHKLPLLRGIFLLTLLLLRRFLNKIHQ